MSEARAGWWCSREAVRHVLPPSTLSERRDRLPAFYESWSARRPSGGRGLPGPVGWDTRTCPSGSGARVAAVVHVFYPDLLDELVRHLAAITVPFDLIVTDASGGHLALETRRCRSLGAA